MLITFEGIDGSGKSTQIALLKQRLAQEGHKVAVFREPGGTQISEKVRELLLNPAMEMHPVTELLLFSAARAQLVDEKITPLLKRDAIVILDRFYDSTTAYQGYGRASLPLKDIRRLNRIASHQKVPDVTFYLQVTLQQARQRTQSARKDRMERSGATFYKNVVAGFEALAQQEDRFVAVDASGSSDHTHKAIWKHLSERFSNL